MGLLNAGSSGWCLRWSATASWVVYDSQHGRYSRVSARGSGDGGEVLKGSPVSWVLLQAAGTSAAWNDAR